MTVSFAAPLALARAPGHHEGDDVGRGQVPKVQGEAIGQEPALKKERTAST